VTNFVITAVWVFFGFAVGFGAGHVKDEPYRIQDHNPRLELYLSCLKSLKDNPGVVFDCEQFLTTPEMNWSGPPLHH
jgi:hypothetical protein